MKFIVALCMISLALTTINPIDLITLHNPLNNMSLVKLLADTPNSLTTCGTENLMGVDTVADKVTELRNTFNLPDHASIGLKFKLFAFGNHGN